MNDGDLADLRLWLLENPAKAEERASVWLDEERSNFPAECNLCNGPITNGEFASGAAILNGVGEMWHVGCED